MVKILFASNNLIHFPTAVSSSLVGSFDSTRVPYAISFPTGQTIDAPVFLPSDTEDTWFHFQFYTDYVEYYGNYHLISAYDSSNRLLFDYYKQAYASSPAGQARLLNGNTITTVDAAIGVNPAVRNAIDIHYKTNILGIELRIYVNNALSITIVFATNPNSYQKPVRFRLGPGFGGSSHISEFLVANGDTRNARLNLLRPITIGAHADWQGTILSLIDEDLSTGLATLDPAAKHSLLLSPYVGSTNISNVSIVTNTTRGINSPTKFKHFFRSSGIDYLSEELSIPQTLQYNITDTTINPATSLPWASSDLSAIETGFLSVA